MNVEDNAGARLSGTTVIITGTGITGTTDANGTFFHNICGADPAGNSIPVTTVTAQKSGYMSQTMIPTANNFRCTALMKLQPSAVGPGVTAPSPPSVPPLIADKFVGNVQLMGIALGVIIAIIRIILGTYKLMSGGDDPIALEEGRDMITSSILGLLVILFAVTLFRIIASNILGIIN